MSEEPPNAVKSEPAAMIGRAPCTIAGCHDSSQGSRRPPVPDEQDDAGAEGRRRADFPTRRANARDQAEHRRRRRTGALLTDKRFEVSVDLVKALIAAGFLTGVDPASLVAGLRLALVDWMRLRAAKPKK